MDKQMIEEMAKVIEEAMAKARRTLGGHNNIAMFYATMLTNAGYRKIPEGAVVLTKDEYDRLKQEKQLAYDTVKGYSLTDIEQKAEIERLTREKTESAKTAVEVLEQNLELQKQVDELKAENTELYKEHTALIASSILQKQKIRKEIAKEILQEGKHCLSKSLQDWIKEQFGVEAK